MSANIKTGGTGKIKTSSDGNAQIYTMNPEFERAVGFISDEMFEIIIRGTNSIFVGGQFYNEDEKVWENVHRSVLTNRLIPAYEYPWGFGLYFRGTQNSPVSMNGESWEFVGYTNVICRGNIKYLLDFNASNKITLPDSAFFSMFSGWDKLIAAPSFPNDSEVQLSKECYMNMFKGCTNLVIAPQLPNMFLKSHCYYSMFEGCTSLKICPTLPSESFSNYCYNNMFKDCLNLRTIPNLSHIRYYSSGNDYVSNMFFNSIIATTTPEGQYTQPYVIDNLSASQPIGNNIFKSPNQTPLSIKSGETIYIDASIAIV